jgi:hypothetical protein
MELKIFENIYWHLDVNGRINLVTNSRLLRLWRNRKGIGQKGNDSSNIDYILVELLAVVTVVK